MSAEPRNVPACPAFFAVIPAAGIGMRMGLATPKQYLEINGRSVLAHSVAPLLQHPHLQHMIVALAPDDTHWQHLPLAQHEKISTVVGGATRCHSVLNAISALAQRAPDDAWVLVHDAVRPCLSVSDLQQLLVGVGNHASGGILASPVYDTLKYCSVEEEIQLTVPRERLWCAHTPQMLRLGLLRQALEHALANEITITDDAAAVEALAVPPLVVIPGERSNIKLTQATDLAWVTAYLQGVNRCSA